VYPNISPPGQPAAWLSTPTTKTDYTYDDNGNLKTETSTRTLSNNDIESIKRTFNYDAAGQLLKTTVERKINTGDFVPIASPSPTVTYDLSGRRASETRTRTLADRTTETQRTSYTYNERGDLVRTTYPDLSFTESAYDDAGSLA